MPRVITTTDERQTRQLGLDIASSLHGGCLVALSGELGTGKTVLVRGICEYFHCERQVTSPTFTIMNEYLGTAAIVHCDLYRLNSIAEMLSIGLDEMFGGERIVLVEWAERALQLLPVPRREILCEYGDREEERRYTVVEVQAENNSVLHAHSAV